MYSVFPELLRYCKNSVPLWVLEILKKYPSVDKISRLKPEQLCKINYVDAEKASSIINKAKTSVASRSNKTDSFLIQHLATEIQHKQLTIKQQKEFLRFGLEPPDFEEAITNLKRYLMFRCRENGIWLD